MKMENSYSALESLCSVLSFIALIFAYFPTAKTDSKNGTTTLVLRLTHRDSLSLPFHNPNQTKSHATNNSQDYVAHYDDFRSNLHPLENAIFLVSFSIGDPPLPVLLAMDTGSPLTWLLSPKCNCANCASNQTEPVYDPRTSRTSTALSCRSQSQCMEYFQRSNCGQESHSCVYSETYVDGATSQGILVTEKFTFSTSTGATSVIPDLLFGCTFESSGNVRRLTGILGLDAHNEHSLVHRVGKKFSYCIGNASDRSYNYNQLILGEGAILDGDKTPMKLGHQHYVVGLQGISVGEKELEINRREYEDFNIAIDSGSTVTLLVRSAFEKLKQEVMDMLAGLVEFTFLAKYERPCYREDLARDLKGFPTVTLHLDGGVDVSLDTEGMFHRVRDGEFCMAVGVAPYGVYMILGLLAQQYYNVGFDLNAMRVSFWRIDCELLED